MIRKAFSSRMRELLNKIFGVLLMAIRRFAISVVFLEHIGALPFLKLFNIHFISFLCSFFYMCRRNYVQSSIRSPVTRANSLVLFVTSIRPCDLACPAINRSMGPIGVPFLSSSALICP